VPTVSLVGYTNAGKSTLLNHLTDAGVLVEDRLFSTLDPTARKLRLPNRAPIVVTDTVGFIRKLPHGLVEAFKSTLEEVALADLLVHIVDASRPEPEVDVAAVDEVLGEIGATEVPRLLIFNKLDVVEPEDGERLLRRYPDAKQISAVTGAGVDGLLEEISQRLEERTVEIDALIPYAEGTLIAKLHDEGRVIESTHTDDGVQLKVKARKSDMDSLAPYVLNGASRGGREPT
jgi:GTP-binding protein HflX